MLRFFRNIRQKLIEQDNVRKYLWYALGEILLVMIGILLALQVNNWNEEYKTSQRTNAYLETLLTEVQSNTEKLTHNLARIDQNIGRTILILDRLNTARPDTITDQQIIELLNGAVLPLYLQTLDRTVFYDLISSGIHENIQDQILKKQLLKTGELFEFYDLYLSRANSTWTDYLMPYQIKNYTVINTIDTLRGHAMPDNDTFIHKEAYINNQYFNNQLRSKLIFYRNLADHIERMNSDMELLATYLKN
ncbi:MAG: hypothetical protein JJ895_07050 [Balneolaceae bacterium]|nr:hypothetical protein [Balneolaceae bacterium]